MITSKCEEQIVAQTTICSKCGGLKSLGLLIESGWSLKIEKEWSMPGDQPVILACKCGRGTFNPKRDGVPLTMPSANDRQVGGNHYKVGGEEHWDRVTRLGLDYFQAQITKYTERCWRKNGLEDLKKARHFLDKYIEICEARTKCAPQFQGVGPQTAAEAGAGYVDQDRQSGGMAGESVSKFSDPASIAESELADRLGGGAGRPHVW